MKKYMLVLLLAIFAQGDQLLAENQMISEIVSLSKTSQDNHLSNQEVLANIQGTVVENAGDLSAILCRARDLVKEKPVVAGATVAGVAALYGLYKTKDAIIGFAKKYPYSTAALIAFVAGGTGMWYYSIPLKTCAQTAGTVLFKGPLMAAQWMQGIMAIKFGFDYAKNIFNEEDEKQALEVARAV